MIRPSHLLVTGIGLLVLVLLASGPAPIARVLLEAGLPHMAASLLSDPAARGAALFRAGRYAEARGAFADAGDTYNEGVAAALAQTYAAALVAWDRRLTEAPADHEARANHKLVTALLSGNEFQASDPPKDKDRSGDPLEAARGQGKARAASTGDDANSQKTGFWMPEITGEGLRRVPQIFDAQFIAANERWLATLQDQPGLYLRARLAAEQKAREADGTALPAPEDPR
ncbi:MAG: hypothetical protein AAFV19_08540 [Pseudomonadota bacterium]